MPQLAKLVTLTQAKAQLGITLPAGDPIDVEVQDKLNNAEDRILRYLQDNPDVATWVDPTSAPGVVIEAIVVALTEAYQFRGDDDHDPAIVQERIDHLLAQLHTPAVA